MREMIKNSDKKEENCQMKQSEKKSQRAVMQIVKSKLRSNGCSYMDREIMMRSNINNNNSRVVKGSYHNSRVVKGSYHNSRVVKGSYHNSK